MLPCAYQHGHTLPSNLTNHNTVLLLQQSVMRTFFIYHSLCNSDRRGSAGSASEQHCTAVSSGWPRPDAQRWQSREQPARLSALSVEVPDLDTCMTSSLLARPFMRLVMSSMPKWQWLSQSV